MKELTLAKNSINDLETRLRNEDISKARGELSEIGQLLKNHNSRRNEHQSSLRQSMEQLENQVRYFSSLEDIKSGDEKWNWFSERVNNYDRELMNANSKITNMMSVEAKQERMITDLQSVKTENESLLQENRRLKENHERLSSTNVVLKGELEAKSRQLNDGYGKVRNLSTQLDEMRSYHASPLKRYDSPNRSRLQD